MEASEKVVPSQSRVRCRYQSYITPTQCRQHSSYYCSSTFNWKLTFAASRRFSSRVCNSVSSSSVPFITMMSSSTYAFPHCKKTFSTFLSCFWRIWFPENCQQNCININATNDWNKMSEVDLWFRNFCWILTAHYLVILYNCMTKISQHKTVRANVLKVFSRSCYVTKTASRSEIIKSKYKKMCFVSLH